MIRINLLGQDTAIDHSGRLMIAGYFASVMVCLIAFFFLQKSVTSRVEHEKEEVVALEGQLEQLKKTTAEVRELERKKIEIDQVTATIARLKLSQEGPVRVLDDLNSAIPAKAWLRDVEEKNGIMKFSGMALGDADVVALLRNLEASNYFADVTLVENISTSLLKVTAFNHFTSRYTYYTVRVEKKDDQLRLISDEARRLGLKYETLQGPPVMDRFQAGTVKVMAGGDAAANAKTREAGVFKRHSIRTEKISAWAALDSVKAKAFVVTAKVIYSGKVKAFQQAAAEAAQQGGDAAKGGKPAAGANKAES